MQDGLEGAIPWLKLRAAAPPETAAPFFLVISLVNPHDLHMYCKNLDASDYPQKMLQGSIRQVPPTWAENKTAAFKPQASGPGGGARKMWAPFIYYGF